MMSIIFGGLALALYLLGTTMMYEIGVMSTGLYGTPLSDEDDVRFNKMMAWFWPVIAVHALFTKGEAGNA